MALENLLYQYNPNHTTIYSLGYDWMRKPEDIIPRINKNIKAALGRLNIDGDFNAKFSFRMPDQAHILPLFQKELFSDLIDFHNTNSDTNGFVHPYTLMMVDPNLRNLSVDIKSRKGAFVKLYGEDAVQHELAHFLALQELWKSGAKGNIEFVLQWEKIKISYGLMLEGEFIPDEISNDFDRTYTIGAPLFPSSEDLQIERKLLLSSPNLRKLLTLILFNLSKLTDQGSTLFHTIYPTPLNSKEMLQCLLPEWRHSRDSLINFTIWEDIMKKI